MGWPATGATAVPSARASGVRTSRTSTTNTTLSVAEMFACSMPPVGPKPSSGEMPMTTRLPTFTPSRPLTIPGMMDASLSVAVAGEAPNDLSNSAPSAPLTAR